MSCNSCHDVQRQSEYTAGAHWVWPRRLVTTIHHQTPNYQLPSKPTPTCPKAQWPAPLQYVLLHAALTPTASHFTPKMPHDSMTYSCSEKYFPPSACVPPFVRTLNFTKRIKSICLRLFQAELSAAKSTASHLRGNKVGHAGFKAEVQDAGLSCTVSGSWTELMHDWLD